MSGAVPSRRFSDVRWDRWTPGVHATLLFVVRDGRMLLIRKKRGLGAGKINGPGGKVDPGESARDAAVREVEEELGVTPIGVEERGELSFQFVDGLAMHVRVFTASGCRGEPRETEEAIPLWTPLDRIPYDEMWADDRIWMPVMLAGRRFAFRALFDGDAMLGWEMEEGR